VCLISILKTVFNFQTQLVEGGAGPKVEGGIQGGVQ